MYKSLELFYYFFQGILFFQVLALGVFYFVTRRKDALYFQLFLLFASINFFIAAPELFYNMKDEEVLTSRWFRFFNTPFAMMSGVFYTCFLKEFFSDIVQYNMLDKVLRITIRVQLAMFIPFYVFYFLRIPTEFIFNLINFIGLSIGAWIIYVIFKKKIIYANTVAFGTIFYLTGSLFTTWLLLKRLSPTDHIMAIHFPFFPLKLGILFQTMSYLIAILNKWYHQSLEEKTTAILNERNRIAEELHDDIGSTLSGISLYSYLAKNQLETSSENSPTINKALTIIQTNTSDVISKLQDIVWMNTSRDENLSIILAKLKSYAQELTTSKNIAFNLSIHTDLEQTDHTDASWKNIYLLFKEAIHNAVKYAHCTTIELKVDSDHEYLYFKLKDNGQGIHPENKNTGNGMQNMHKRARELNGTLTIYSQANEGTEIIFKMKNQFSGLSQDFAIAI